MQNQSDEEQSLNPSLDSARARASAFGVDLTLVAARLKLSPEARLDDLQRLIDDLETARADARASSTRKASADGND